MQTPCKMHWQTLWLLPLLTLLSCCHNINAESTFSNPSGRVPLQEFRNSSRSEHFRIPTRSSNAALNLPNGFHPQSPPTHPLLYPFATQAPTSGWQPIVNGSSASQRGNYIPLLRERIRSVTETPAPSTEEGPVLESIVYGTWKPERPLRPDKIFNISAGHKVSASHENSGRTTLSGQFAGFKNQAPDTTFTPNMRHLKPTTRYSSRVKGNYTANRKHGRQRIAGKRYERHKGATPTIAVITLNVTNPQLLDMAIQINNSVEVATLPAQQNTTVYNKSPHPQAEDQTATSTPKFRKKTTTSIPKQSLTNLSHPMQPTTATIALPPNNSIVSNSSEPPQALNSLNIPASMLPQIPFNISKLGIPYEDQNAAEEPAICVPLLVREQSNLDSTDYVEVERVYCFPLPLPNVEIINSNSTLATDTKVDVFNYNEATMEAFGLKIESGRLSVVISTLLLSFHLELI